jgi:hypothetical protein
MFLGTVMRCTSFVEYRAVRSVKVVPEASGYLSCITTLFLRDWADNTIVRGGLAYKDSVEVADVLLDLHLTGRQEASRTPYFIFRTWFKTKIAFRRLNVER